MLLHHVRHISTSVCLTHLGGDLEGNRPCLYQDSDGYGTMCLVLGGSRSNISTSSRSRLSARKKDPDPAEHGKRFFNILASLVAFGGHLRPLQGQFSSGRLNRLCRRVTALDIAAAVIPISLWTISNCGTSPMVPAQIRATNDHLRFLAITAKTRQCYMKRQWRLSFNFL